jgi:CAAX protease family protein
VSSPDPAPPELPAPPPEALPEPTWRPIEAVPVLAIAFGSFVLLASVIGLLGLGEAAAFAVGGLLLEASFGVTSLLWIRGLHRASIAAIGFPVRLPREVGQGVLGGIATYAISFFVAAPLVLRLVQTFTHRPPTVPEQVPGDAEGAALSLIGLVAIVLAPLGEELFFRAFLFRALRRHGFAVAAGVSSVLFGFVHVVGSNFLLVPILTVVGLCLAYVYERTGRIAVPIAAHMTFNVIGFLFLTLA